MAAAAAAANSDNIEVKNLAQDIVQVAGGINPVHLQGSGSDEGLGQYGNSF